MSLLPALHCIKLIKFSFYTILGSNLFGTFLTLPPFYLINLMHPLLFPFFHPPSHSFYPFLSLFSLLQAENDWPAFQTRLETLRNTIIHRGSGTVGSGNTRAVVSLCGEQHVIDAALPIAESFVGHIPTTTTCMYYMYILLLYTR